MRTRRRERDALADARHRPRRSWSRGSDTWHQGVRPHPTTLNRFLDHFGVLDADYEAAAQGGRTMWVLSPDRTPCQGAGRSLIILDSARASRAGRQPPAEGPRPRPAPIARRRCLAGLRQRFCACAVSTSSARSNTARSSSLSTDSSSSLRLTARGKTLR